MRAIPKSAKRHPAAKKCCGWEEPAICPGDICPYQQYLPVTDTILTKL